MKIAKNIKRIVCGVSGGVDSSVATFLLKNQGHDVIGAFMRNWDGKDELGVCAADRDAEDAERTCKALGIPFIEVNFVKEYWNEVFENLLKDYQIGLTPNPDIMCNYHVKFDKFFDYAQQRLAGDYVATGHYANISIQPDSSVKLLKAKDTFKDQTFFLSHVNQSALQKTFFPIGHLLKNQVRQIAKDTGLLHVAERPDSTGICFIGKRSFQSFISEYINPVPGPFIDVDTRLAVGEHQGIHMWTLGQRCRLGGFLQPYFVASKEPESHTIYVASGTNHPALFSRSFTTGLPHWIHSDPTQSESSFDCWFRFQHTKPLTAAKITRHKSGLFVELGKSLRALTPGQYAVFYSDDECLGCARIANTLNDKKNPERANH